MNQNYFEPNPSYSGFDQPSQYPIDQSPPQEMSIQDMEDLKQQYLDEMKSMINQIQIKDYRNERIDIRYRRECEIKIDELKGKFNGMSIKINKKKELRQLEQAANDLAAKKSTKLVKYQSSGILCVIVVMLEYRRIYNTHPCS
ncbi:hypothetical protein Tco_0870308 [Tanacetum coccineum]